VGDRVRGDIVNVRGTGESWAEEHDKRDDLEDLGLN